MPCWWATSVGATLDLAEGLNEVVTIALTGTVTGGRFTLSFDGQTTESRGLECQCTRRTKCAGGPEGAEPG